MTSNTREGDLLGTLAYMSPEAVEGDPNALDTRTDVYSLGVMLYELLAERPPFDLGGLPLLEGVRRIREGRAPLLRSIAPHVPREVEAIVARSIEPDRELRYASAADLSTDLRRFLRGEAVAARGHSALYVLRKALRRHRRLALSTGVVLVSVLAFAVMSSMQAARNRELAEGLRAELRANQIERGRSLAQTTNPQSGEDLIWREHLLDPDSRHSFWALWELYHSYPVIGRRAVPFDDPLQRLPRPGRQTTSIALHPGSNLFAIGTRDGLVFLGDATSLEFHARLDAPELARSLAFDVTGNLLAGAREDGGILVWDVAARTLQQQLEDNLGPSSPVIFAADGSLLAGCLDGNIAVRDLTAGSRRVLEGHRKRVTRLAVGHDGSLLASGGRDADVFVWRDLSGPPITRLPVDPGELVALCFSGDERLLATGGRDGGIKVWNPLDGTLLHEFRVPYVRWIAFHPHEQNTLVASGHWRLTYFDLASGEQRSHPALATYSQFLPDPGWILTGGTGHVQLWEDRSRARLDLDEHAGLVAAAWDPRGHRAASADEDGVVRLWDVEHGTRLAELRVHTDRIRALAFAPDGSQLAAGCESGQLAVFDPGSGRVHWLLDGHAEVSAHSVCFDPSGPRLAHTGRDGRVRIRHARTGEVERELPLRGGAPIAVRYAPDGLRLAVTHRDRRVRVWSPDAELVFEQELPGTPWTPAFSDDGRRLAVGTWSDTIHVWNLASGEREADLTGHLGLVRDVEFRPDDPDTLLSSSQDGTVKLWDVVHGRCLATITLAEDWGVHAVDYAPDGDAFVAGVHGRGVLVDLAYYDKHVAGNARFQIERFGRELGSAIERERLERWVREVEARPWPRFVPTSGR